jgi:hypothetical protein
MKTQKERSKYRVNDSDYGMPSATEAKASDVDATAMHFIVFSTSKLAGLTHK